MSECLFLTSKSNFIWVYNQTLHTKPNLFESPFPMSECLFPTRRYGPASCALTVLEPIPYPRARVRFMGPFCFESLFLMEGGRTPPTQTPTVPPQGGNRTHIRKMNHSLGLLNLVNLDRN